MPANDRRHPQPPQAASQNIYTDNEKEETDFIKTAADALRAKPVDGSSKHIRGTPPTAFRRRIGSRRSLDRSGTNALSSLRSDGAITSSGKT
jgi:hypothetical protein